MKRVLSAVCAIVFAASMTVASFAADYGNDPNYSGGTTGATSVSSSADIGTAISNANSGSTDLLISNTTGSTTVYISVKLAELTASLTSLSSALSSDYTKIIPVVDSSPNTSGITGLPSSIASAVGITPDTAINSISPAINFRYGIPVPSNGTWKLYYVDGTTAYEGPSLIASANIVWIGVNHASSYLLIKENTSSGNWVSAGGGSSDETDTSSTSTDATSTSTSSDTATASAPASTDVIPAVSNTDPNTPAPGLPEPPPVVAPSTGTENGNVNAPAVVPGGTDGGNAAGTGRGSYDQAGNYVGAGNGQYDASGNYVGFVGSTGSAPHTGVAVPAFVVVSAGAIALCVGLMKKKNNK